MGMAEENKGNEDRIAELFNTNQDWALIETFGKIGPEFPQFREFVKKAGDITTCGPDTEEKLASVQFQFQFTPDGKTFSLSYINMKAWTVIGIVETKSVLEYVFE